MCTPSAVEDVFLSALSQASPEERDAYLEQACRADPDLRRQVERLLRAHALSSSFLNKPFAGYFGTASAQRAEAGERGGPGALGEAVGDSVGPYKLLRKLGEGGMGVVWVAEQDEPVRRRVALKVIKPGMDSDQALRRFEVERQALALMDHNHIAKVFDADATPDGRPYFVMELIDGVPITRYCDELNLPIRERLGLFVAVCLAVQHAHQKGVIHRDLKPSNVLVALHDGEPIPKVIDFGVAKGTGHQLTRATKLTDVGAIVGTLEYMAPEQADVGSQGVDTRADIYALGVLLYELLTGTTPLDPKRLNGAGLVELLRRVKEEEPPAPSTRLTQSRETLASLAAQRRTDPARLTREVRGELDWIVLKCLEKNRSRRYESAGGLARDVQRHLADEPVEACPPSAGYRLRKFARRHRAALAVASAFLLITQAGAGGIYFAYREAVAAEEKANAHVRKAQEAEADMRAFAEFLASHVLATTRPEGVQSGVGVNVTVAEALERAEPALERVFQDRPRAEALARQHIGVTWRNLGRYAEAARHLERALALRREALGEDHPDTADSANSLGVAYLHGGKPEKAVPLFAQALASLKATLGEDHPLTLQAMNNLAAAYQEGGKRELALPLQEEVLARRRRSLGEDHPQTLQTMNQLASSYRKAEKLDRAWPLLQQALSKCSRKLGEEHPDTLYTLSNLVAWYQAAGKPRLALGLLEPALARYKRRLGEDHPETLTAANSLAEAYRDVGQLDQALALHEDTLGRRRRKLGDDHPDTLQSLNNLGWTLHGLARHARALPLLEQALAGRRRMLGEEHPDTLQSLNNVAVCRVAAGEPRAAVPLHERALAGFRRKLGEGHPHTLASMNNLALAYRGAGQPGKALPFLERALAGCRRQLGDDHPQTLQVTANLALTSLEARRPGDALPLVRRVLAAHKKRLGPGLPLADCQASIALQLLKADQHAEAEPPLRECLASRENVQADGWATFNARSLLGEALLGQKKYADAGPLLLAGYEGLRKRQDTIPPGVRRQRLAEALARLVRLHETTGNEDDAAKWRKELEAVTQGAKK